MMQKCAFTVVDRLHPLKRAAVLWHKRSSRRDVVVEQALGVRHHLPHSVVDVSRGHALADVNPANRVVLVRVG